MKILFFGDVFGRPGREALRDEYEALAQEYSPDFVVANIENIAHGMGINLSSIQELEQSGAVFHCYTSGNHHFSNKGTFDVSREGSIPLIRPLNYPEEKEGVGYMVVESGAKKLLVINVMGRIFMKIEGLLNPFREIEKVLDKYSITPDEGKEKVDGILVDFHAETTAEKRTMGFFLDGRVSAVVGTHTHVPTADAQILEGGTAYISDVGMVGPYNSCLGLQKEHIIEEMLNEKRGKRDVGQEGSVEIGAVIIETHNLGLSRSIKSIRKIVNN